MSDENTQTTPADAPAAERPASLEELRTRARELNVSGRSGMTREGLEAAIAAAEAGKSDAEVAEAANATLGDVSARAVDVVQTTPAGGMTRVGPRVELDGDDVELAPHRAIYVDPNGLRRVVAGGKPVPAGWEYVERASLAARTREAEAASDHIVTDKAERGPRD